MPYRDECNDDSRDGSKQHPKKEYSLPIPDELLHAQLSNEDKPDRFTK